MLFLWTGSGSLGSSAGARTTYTRLSAYNVAFCQKSETVLFSRNHLSRRRRFSMTAKSHHRYEKKHVRQEIYTHRYIIIAWPVGALDGLRSLTFGSPENFWEVSIHRKKIKKMFYERAPPGNIPPRSISAVRYAKWPKSRI